MHHRFLLLAAALACGAPPDDDARVVVSMRLVSGDRDCPASYTIVQEPDAPPGPSAADCALIERVANYSHAVCAFDGAPGCWTELKMLDRGDGTFRLDLTAACDDLVGARCSYEGVAIDGEAL